MKTQILEAGNVEIVGQDLTEKTEKGDEKWTGAKLHTTCDNKYYRKIQSSRIGSLRRTHKQQSCWLYHQDEFESGKIGRNMLCITGLQKRKMYKN